jgi:hypothetical protein
MFALILRSAVLPAWRSSYLSTYNTLFTLYNDCLFSNHQFMEETMSEKKNLFSVNPDVSRRDFLRLSGLAAAGVMVAACGTPPAPMRRLLMRPLLMRRLRLMSLTFHVKRP